MLARHRLSLPYYTTGGGSLAEGGADGAVYMPGRGTGAKYVLVATQVRSATTM
jgi:hypothetical protein